MKERFVWATSTALKTDRQKLNSRSNRESISSGKKKDFFKSYVWKLLVEEHVEDWKSIDKLISSALTENDPN